MSKKATKPQFNLDLDTKLVTKDKSFWVSSNDAKARYDTHKNGSEDVNYFNYHKRIFDEFIGIYIKQGNALDYGCGEGAMQTKFIPNLNLYDLYYYNDEAIFNRTFDTIILIETIEHFESPWIEFDRLIQLLEPQGRLLIQTLFYPDFKDISSWWYVRDVTHVSFFCLETFESMCKRYGLRMIFTDFKSRVVLEKTVL